MRFFHDPAESRDLDPPNRLRRTSDTYLCRAVGPPAAKADDPLRDNRTRVPAGGRQ